MSRRSVGCAIALLSFLGSVVACLAAEAPAFTRTEDVIYGRKHGTALTMDVFAPGGTVNGAAVVCVISGGWVSSHEAIHPSVFAELLRRGYTVFAVVHGSQPWYTVPEAVEDLHRSVRFIRHHAVRYHIDPERIGIMGGSAGGHLSLMIGTAGGPGKADAKDPVDRVSSRVQAVACFFPPTDFLNYGSAGRDVFQALEKELAPFKAPFDFREWDEQTKRLVLIRDESKRLDMARWVSPISHVTPDDAPTLIIHGDADKLVPIQQAKTMEEKLKEAGVPVKLIVKPGADHGWSNWLNDVAIMGDWFDTYLKGVTTQPHREEEKAAPSR